MEMEQHHFTLRSSRRPILPYAIRLNLKKSIPGSIDWTTRVSDGEFLIRGWMLHPRTSLSSIQVYLDGNHVGTARPIIRDDLARNISWIPHAAGAGFEIRLDPSLFSSNAIHHLDVIGYRQPTATGKWAGALKRLFTGGDPFGVPVGRYHTLCRTDIDAVAPSPPAHLMGRVVGHH